MNNYCDFDSLAGGLFGLLIGDVVGVPYEFKSSNDIKDIEMFPFGLKNKSHPDVPFGTWSDDGAQSLILLDSLLEQNKLDLNHFLTRLSAWLFSGYMAIDNKVFDVGIQSYTSIANYKNKGFFEVEMNPGESKNGNGSLMRCLPLVLWYKGSDQGLVYLAHQQSLVTHPHVRSQVCCAFYCLIARKLLDNISFDEAFNSAKASLIQIYKNNLDNNFLFEFENKVLSFDVNTCQGTGYVVDSLMTSLLCLQECNYEDVIKRAISFGNDTDTTACIAGGLAGIIYGLNGIPQKWLDGLRGKELVYPLLERLKVQMNFKFKVY